MQQNINRKVLFYLHQEYDAGAYDSPELDNPTEQSTGFFIGIVHNHFVGSDGIHVQQSEILIEKEDDHTIISILPKQLVRFID